ncbi:MAG: nucleotidyltransferase domain-containing protein [Bacteroidales bacterium]|nr:nucleotidyltransferase domain-containing protein [Bacteroidales bacterium]
MIDADNILKYLSLNKVRFKQEYHLTKIGLFGSIARGEQTDKSDIDLVIEFEPDTPDLYTLKYKLKKEIQEKFDLQVDICRLKYIKPIFTKQIQSEVRYV